MHVLDFAYLGKYITDVFLCTLQLCSRFGVIGLLLLKLSSQLRALCFSSLCLLPLQWNS